MPRRLVVHYLPKSSSMMGCGRMRGPDIFHTSDIGNVNCKRCKKSQVYRLVGMKGVTRG